MVRTLPKPMMANQIRPTHQQKRLVKNQRQRAVVAAGIPRKQPASPPKRMRQKVMRRKMMGQNMMRLAKNPLNHQRQNRLDGSSGGSSSTQAKKPAPKTAAKNNNRNRDDELPSPPDCSGNTLAETGHVPAFLRR